MKEEIILKFITDKNSFKDNFITTLIEEFSMEEIIDFVQSLDKRIANWDYTNKLYDYYKDAHKQFLTEEKLYRKKEKDSSRFKPSQFDDQ